MSFVDLFDAFIGIRIKVGNDHYFGWILLDKGANNDWLTIRMIAFNPVANMPAVCKTTTTNISQIESKTDKISIFPNPVSKNISIYGCHVNSIEIRNIKGDIVSFLTEEINVDFSNFQNGIYFFIIKTDKETICKKIIKQ